MDMVKPSRRTGAMISSISAAGDQGKDLAGCIVATFLGQLNCECLEISDLLSGHGWWLVVGAVLPCP